MAVAAQLAFMPCNCLAKHVFTHRAVHPGFWRVRLRSDASRLCTPKGFQGSRTDCKFPRRSFRVLAKTENGSSNGSNGADGFDFDLFTIGAGSGGVRASRFAAANYGAKVAVCEMPFNTIASDTEGGAGGTCVLRGCVPKKIFVYCSEFAEDFKDAQGFGWSLGGSPSLDWESFLKKKNSELQRLNGIYGSILSKAGVTVIEGRGSVVDAHTVEVDGQRYTARHILIATGGRAVVPNLPGAEHAIISDQALELPALPNSIAIVGGGYIAVEFAGIFARLGVETHLMARQPKLIRGFDEECRTFFTEQYINNGVKLHMGQSPTHIEVRSEGGYTLHSKGGDGAEHALDVDLVMMATGRKPNTRGLGLEKVGVSLDKAGAIQVDKYSCTHVPSIWAIGDVTNRMNLTPVALMEAMAFCKTAFGGEDTPPDFENVASAVFGWPQLSTVGMTEEQAVESVGDVDVYTSAFKPMKNTISGNGERTFMKILVDSNTDKLLGFHMVGPDAAEIMQGLAVAVKFGITKSQLDSVVGIHPSAAEEFVTMRSATRKHRNKVLVTA